MKRLRLVTFALLVFFWSAPLLAEETLVLATVAAPPLRTSDDKGFVDLLLKEVFRRNGLDVEFDDVPGERALLNANAGLDDGITARIGGIENKYKNLMPVPESAYKLHFVAFTKDPTMVVDDWNDLKPYSVAHITGWKVFEQNVTDVAELTKVKDIKQLFGLLESGRADVVLLERWMGLAYIRDHNITSTRMLSPPLAEKAMYTYLHKKHKDLLPKLAKALRQMKADGSYQRIYDQVLEPLAIN